VRILNDCVNKKETNKNEYVKIGTNENGTYDNRQEARLNVKSKQNYVEAGN